MRGSFLLHRALSSREDGGGAMKVAKLKIPTNNLASMGKGAFDVFAAAASKQSSLLPMATSEQSNDKQLQQQEREKKQVCFYASNIAACIGKNPYTRPHQALEDMWIKQFPQSYQRAVSKMDRELNIKIKTKAQTVAAAVAKNDVGNIVKQAIATSAASASAAAAVDTDKHARAEINNAVSTRATHAAQQVLEAAAPDLSSEVKARVQDVLRASLPADKKATAVVAVLERAGRAEPLTAAAQAAGTTISETLLRASTEAGLIEEHLQREIYTGHGIRSENPALLHYASRYKRQVELDSRFRTKALLSVPCKRQVLIGGRVDAIATCDGQQILVEIKNRMKRFFAEVPLYEKVQTQALLEIFGFGGGELVQCLRLGGGEGGDCLLKEVCRGRWCVEGGDVPRLVEAHLLPLHTSSQTSHIPPPTLGALIEHVPHLVEAHPHASSLYPYTSSGGGLDLQVIPFSKNAAFWKEELEPSIAAFALVFDSFLEDEDKMRRLLLCRDLAAKEKLVSQWLAP